MAKADDPEIIIIREAREDDIARLADTLAPDVGGVQLDNRWQEHHAGYREMLVAEVGTWTVGTISFGGVRHQRAGSLRMFALDVGAAYRRRGIATALIGAVEAEALRRGLRSVHLEVAVDTADALRLYERMGSRLDGEPITDRWWRVTDDGGREKEEELSWVMVKPLS